MEPFDDPALELKRRLEFESQEMEEPYWCNGKNLVCIN